MDLHILCREANISIDVATPHVMVTGIKTDSRTVVGGDLFICIRGKNADGHQYIDEAVARGAVAVVAEIPFRDEIRVPVVFVADTRHAAAMLYDAWYGHPSKAMKLIAVTGTNGKTSVTHMLRAIFEGAMHRCGLIGTVRCYSAGRQLDIRAADPLANMTTPDPAELYHMLSVMKEDGVEYVFMEATSHALSLRKLDALSFEAAVFTNLTPEHLDFHGNMENYFSAKAKLFSMSKRAIINVDDGYGRRLADLLPSAVTCSVQDGTASFLAEQTRDEGTDGTEYHLISKNLRATVHTPIPGQFTVMNTLEAAATAISLGISPSVILATLGSLNGIDGRMERVRLGAICDFSVFIDYAHTPDALQNLLVSVQAVRREDQRIVLVFGCGGDRDRAKRPVMGRIAARLADCCVVTSDNSRSEDPHRIIREICAGMGDAPRTVIPDRAKAIDFAIRTAKRGDIILLAGKGHEAYEIDRGGRRPFDERKIAMEAAMRYHGQEEDSTL